MPPRTVVKRARSLKTSNYQECMIKGLTGKMGSHKTKAQLERTFRSAARSCSRKLTQKRKK